MSNNWTAEDIPDLYGNIAVVTGANSGIGRETTRALAAKGAQVVMACRDMEKAASAADDIRSTHPDAQLDLMQLDLSNQASIHQFADTFNQRYDQLNLLINNAGIMVPPYGTTADGFEQQFGTNHLGHFALTGLLLDTLLHTPRSQIVTVSSMVHRQGSIDFDDLQWERRPYKAFAAYGQSKLANLLFTYELQRKLALAGADTIAVAAHPGWSNTGLQQNSSIFSSLNRWFAQSAAQGAWPSLYAATAPDVAGGAYYGPGGFMEIWGHPKRVSSSSRSHDRVVAARLWQVSEDLTGVHYDAIAEVTQDV